MKTSELIELLEEKKAQHGDLEVATVWEHYCIGVINREDVYLSKDGTLFIDAEGTSNKREHAVDIHEGEDE